MVLHAEVYAVRSEFANRGQVGRENGHNVLSGVGGSFLHLVDDGASVPVVR